MRFPHLHLHSHYSLLSALPKIPDLVNAGIRSGATALALTDFNSLYGAIEFYKECKEHGIKPIVGLDANIGDGERLVLLAENEDGYKNLLQLVTKAQFENPEKPLFTDTMLAEHKEGLIALARKGRSARMRAIFGDTQFFDDAAMHETFYLKPQDRRAWETMRAIARGAAEQGGMEGEEDNSLWSAKQMEAEFIPAELARSQEIADRCMLELKLGSWVFPKFPLPKNQTPEDALWELIQQGLLKRGMEATEEVQKRIEYEFKIICEKGFAPYFLTVSDLLRFAREQGILATTRGSAGGSLVSYLAGITTINPLFYKLPFERFLNPERPKAPDIDMDFADNRRDEMIDYVRQKYGETHVAQIGTFGTMLARGVVRDVARALGHPYGLGDRIAKEVPMGSQGFPMTLERALKESPELKKMYRDEEDARDIIELGQAIEGCARHISVHAAGVVISPEPLSRYTPLQRDPKGGKIITQYDMYSVEDVGLLKFDFLGIRNLAILADAVEIVEATRGKRIDIENIPLDDAKTYEMLARGETEATFQLNGSGMTRFLKELRASNINDINAMVALYRPGPMESIPAYIERKHNPAKITYLDPRMKDILDQSYGVITYQDDVLQIAVQLGGYSWLEVDALRKAMGKKIPTEMEAQREKLIRGAVGLGMQKQKAEALWKLIEPFAAYGFNKAHAASYGKVAYQTAYMKANYPVEYMAAVMTAEAGDVETIGVMVNECKRMGIPVLPPDVNESFGDFTVILGASPERTEKAAALAKDADKDSIRFGLYSIKNFGRGIADAIIAERKYNGRYASLSDFLRRVKEQSLNKRALESLIQCGALDTQGERGEMLAGLELLLQYHRESTADAGQDSLFAGLGQEISDLRLPPAARADMAERLAWEKELLGLYVSGHPLDRFRQKLARRSMTLAQLREKLTPGMTGIAAGIIEEIRVVVTKGGDQMAFLKLADFDGSIEAVVFPRSFSEHKEILKPESCIALKGRMSNRNGELSMVAEELKAL